MPKIITMKDLQKELAQIKAHIVELSERARVIELVLAAKGEVQKD